MPFDESVFDLLEDVQDYLNQLANMYLYGGPYLEVKKERSLLLERLNCKNPNILSAKDRYILSLELEIFEHASKIRDLKNKIDEIEETE